MRYLLVSIFLVCFLGFARGDGGESETKLNPSSPQQSSYADDDSDMYMEPLDHQPQESNIAEQKEQQESENSFYPSFDQPHGHSRPFFEFQEGAYSQRAQPPFQQVFDAPARFSGYKDGYRSSSNAAPETHSLLGSGNFGVIKGGTFYNENDGEQAEQTSFTEFSDYFHNGHGRPSFYGGGRPNPKPYQHEQFANFKDFADINTPSDRQYSQYVVVYVNKNGTEEPEPAKNKQPKNIIESLAMLDMESETTTQALPEKKLSKSKRKLAQVLPEKKYKVKLLQKEKLTKDLNEPLLALS